MTKYSENGALVNLVNLTPHAVNFITADGRQVDVPPEGVIARLEQHDVISRWIGRIPVYKTEYGEVQNLPDPQPDTIYIVSGMVLSKVPERDDVLSPGALIRNDVGQVIGAGIFSYFYAKTKQRVFSQAILARRLFLRPSHFANIDCRYDSV